MAFKTTRLVAVGPKPGNVAPTGSDFKTLHVKETASTDELAGKISALVITAIEQSSDLDIMPFDEAISHLKLTRRGYASAETRVRSSSSSENYDDANTESLGDSDICDN
uniref:Uncharacterized protein n=1 Tax=Oryza punctata TaxID=4537 RepID=A0A0E0LWK7_ORYPU